MNDIDLINLKKSDRQNQLKLLELQKEFGKEGVQLERIYLADIDHNLFYSQMANIDLINIELGNVISKDQFLALNKTDEKGDRKNAFNVFGITKQDEIPDDMEDDDDDQIKEKIQINNPRKKNYNNEFKDIDINEIVSQNNMEENNKSDLFYGTKFMHTLNEIDVFSK